MINTAVDYIRNVDTFAAIGFICKQEDPFTITSTFNDVVRHLYWEDKDLPAVVSIGRAGIQFGLAASKAAEIENTEAAKELKTKTRAIAFNVASFTWPGWDEEGIDPNSTDVQLGYDAAKLGVRLNEEMDADPLNFSSAFWMLGAHQLAAAKSIRAQQSFSQSAEYAVAASSKSYELLAEAFEILAKAQADPGDSGRTDKMDSVKNALTKEEHGPDFVDQVDTAARVFGISI